MLHFKFAKFTKAVDYFAFSFNGTFSFCNDQAYIFLVPGPVYFDLGETPPTGRICPNGLKLFLASLGILRKNILLGWFGRGNINDIETVAMLL